MRRRRLATSIIASDTAGSCSQSRTRRLLRVVRMPKACSTRQRSGIGTKPWRSRGRGDGEDRAVPGGVAGDVLAGVAAVADQPPQAPAGRVGAREQRVGAALVVRAGGGRHRDEEEAGGARQDVTLATVDLLAAVPTAFALLGPAAHALAVDEAGPGLGAPAGGGA